MMRSSRLTQSITLERWAVALAKMILYAQIESAVPALIHDYS